MFVAFCFAVQVFVIPEKALQSPVQPVTVPAIIRTGCRSEPPHACPLSLPWHLFCILKLPQSSALAHVLASQQMPEPLLPSDRRKILIACQVRWTCVPQHQQPLQNFCCFLLPAALRSCACEVVPAAQSIYPRFVSIVAEWQVYGVQVSMPNPSGQHRHTHCNMLMHCIGANDAAR